MKFVRAPSLSLPEECDPFSTVVGSVGTDSFYVLSHDLDGNRIDVISGETTEPLVTDMCEDVSTFRADNWSFGNVNYFTFRSYRSDEITHLELGGTWSDIVERVNCIRGRTALFNDRLTSYDCGKGEFIPKYTTTFKRKWFAPDEFIHLDENTGLIANRESLMFDLRQPKAEPFTTQAHKFTVSGCNLFFTDHKREPGFRCEQVKTSTGSAWRISGSFVKLFSWHQASHLLAVVVSGQDRREPEKIYMINSRTLAHTLVAEVEEDRFPWYFPTTVCGQPVFCGLTPRGKVEALV